MLTFKQFLLQEAAQDAFVFAFGRYSPPTRGHIEHFLAVQQYAERMGVPYTVYVSKTVDNKKNPVPVLDKINYIKKAIPDLIISPAINMFSILGELIEEGNYKNITYFAGGDYFEDPSEKSMMHRLKQEAEKAGINLDVQSSGERSEGISGTVLRNAVMNNDLNLFLKVSPIGIGTLKKPDAVRMFEITKAGLSAPSAPKKRPVA